MNGVVIPDGLDVAFQFYLDAIREKEPCSLVEAEARNKIIEAMSMRSPKLQARGLTWKLALLAALSVAMSECRSSSGRSSAVIQFTKVPPSDKGGPDTLDTIEGHVTGARPGQRIVLYARSGVWWVQPGPEAAYTEIKLDSTWSRQTHLGTEYAALLIDPGYQPAATIDILPKPGNGIVSLATAVGDKPSGPVHHTLRFSGYDWFVRAAPSSRGGFNLYDPANAWTDADGALHLKIARRDGKWTCAEVNLTRSLGYGTYQLVVRDTSQLEPVAVFGMFTWDGAAMKENHREMDIEVSQWGDPASKNAQYTVQPFYVPANVDRFSAPHGPLTFSFRWEPERVTFKTVRADGKDSGGKPRIVSEHVFKSGVPSAGNESIHINLYIFVTKNLSLLNDAEVVIEKFEYLP